MSIDSDDINELAQAPKKTTGDDGSIEERPIGEVIEADRYTAGKQATSSGPPYGMRIGRLKKPGTP